MNRNDAPKTPATFHVKSFGCQMNVYDGERMAEMLGARGMTAATAVSYTHLTLPTKLEV